MPGTVAVLLSNGACFGALQELHEREGGGVADTTPQNNRILRDRGMQTARDDPLGSPGVLGDLRQRHESCIGVPGVDELIGLSHVDATDDPVTQDIVDSQGLQHLYRRSPVRSESRFGDGKPGDLAGSKRCLARHERLVHAKQDDSTQRVRKPAGGNREAFLDGPSGPCLISCQKDIERRTLGNLSIELTGRPKTEHRDMRRGSPKRLSNLSGCGPEVRGDGDTCFARLYRSRNPQNDGEQRGQWRSPQTRRVGPTLPRETHGKHPRSTTVYRPGPLGNFPLRCGGTRCFSLESNFGSGDGVSCESESVRWPDGAIQNLTDPSGPFVRVRQARSVPGGGLGDLARRQYLW